MQCAAKQTKPSSGYRSRIDNHDTGTLGLLVDPLLHGLRDDPRYKAMRRENEFPGNVVSEKPSFFAKLKRRNV